MSCLAQAFKEAKTVSTDLSVQILWMTADGIEPRTLAELFGCTTTSIQKRYKRALRELCPQIYDRVEGNWMRTIQAHKAQVQMACRKSKKFASEPLREAETIATKAPEPDQEHVTQVAIRLKPEESARILAIANGRRPTTVARELLLQALHDADCDTPPPSQQKKFTPIAAHLDPKNEIGKFWILFQLSKETDLKRRIHFVQYVIKHIPDLHEMTLEELIFFLDDPKAVEFIRQKSNPQAA